MTPEHEALRSAVHEALVASMNQLSGGIHSARLTPEIARAARDFFGLRALEGQDPSREARFLEWFLLERESDVLGQVPFDTLRDVLDEDAVQAARESIAGVFHVTEHVEDGVRVVDVQSGESYDVDFDQAKVDPGHALIGRLLLGDYDVMVPSMGLLVLPHAQPLIEAMHADLSRLELERRLQQVEVEHLLVRPDLQRSESPGVPVEHLEATLDQLLSHAPFEVSATDISEALGRATSPGMVIGPLMDRLAFDTDVDLDKARETLLEIWNARHAGGAGAGIGTPISLEEVDSSVPEVPAPKAPPAPAGASKLESDQLPEILRDPEAEQEDTANGLGAALAKDLNAGLRDGEDVEVLFKRLGEKAGVADEEMAAADPRVSPGSDRSTRIDNFDAEDPGVIGDLEPLVQEYGWEEGLETDAFSMTVLHRLVALQNESPLPHLDVESIDEQDIVRLLIVVYLNATPSDRGAMVQQTYAALKAFAVWLQEAQGVHLQGLDDAVTTEVVERAEGLALASQVLSDPASEAGGPGTRQGVLRIEDLDADRIYGRFDAATGGAEEALILPLPERLAGVLKPNDLVVGAVIGVSNDDLRLQGDVVVLPAVAEHFVN